MIENENKIELEENKFPDSPSEDIKSVDIIQPVEERVYVVKRTKYKQLSWNDYTERLEIDYKTIKETDDMSSTITINNIPNIEEFQELITVLKDESGERFIEFAIVDCGTGRFYYLYKSSKLFNIVQLIRQINRTFHSEYFKQYNVNIGDSIPERNVKTKSEFRLHMSSKIRVIIERLLQDIKISDSSFGLMCCIFTFNRAKERFKELRADKFKIYYRDDGYYKFIKEDIEDSARRGITWLIESLPVMVDDVERNIILFKYYKENNHDSYPELKDDLIYKIAVLDNTIELIKDNKIDLPIKTAMDIRSYEETKELLLF